MLTPAPPLPDSSPNPDAYGLVYPSQPGIKAQTGWTDGSITPYNTCSGSVVMDVREWEQSQSRRSSIKRPWDEDGILTPQSNGWNGAILPPIDMPPYRRASIQQVTEPLMLDQNRYELDVRGSIPKKPRYESIDYKLYPRDELSTSSELHQPRPSHSRYASNQGARGASDPSSSPQEHHQESWRRRSGDVGGGPAGLRDVGQTSPHSSPTSYVCPRCRRLTTHQHDLDFLVAGDESRIPELVLVAQSAATQLTKALNSLNSCLPSKRPSIIRDQNHDQHDLDAADAPMAQQGLKQTLDWLLGKTYLVNELVDKLVQHGSLSSLQQLERDSPPNATNTPDGPFYNMKRRMGADPDDAFPPRVEGGEPTLDHHHRRRSEAPAFPSADELPTTRPQHDIHHMHSSTDGPSRRASIMNPPPAPNRQLPSPPGRSLPSPTSVNFPSPSAASYGSSSQPANLPPSGNAPTALNSYLPPINPASPSDPALQAHTAALQHEVSVQKIALSSLQGEHDKLLAAFSRSQTRASALEKKHAVSDSEIISLSEEKMRLQAQVIELERDVEDLGRSRDEFRQAAVQEGAQYVEIVKKATQLEEIASEERKQWNRLRVEMEQRIESLNDGMGRFESRSTTENIRPVTHTVTIEDIDTPASSVDGPADVKLEPTNEVQFPGPTSNPSALVPHQAHNEDLQEEIRKLRLRCREVEDTLRKVRDETRSVEGIIQALGEAGRSIMTRADRTLGNLPDL